VEFRLRVYYEDTDAGGIVYYANYLKFIERARTEALLALGLSQTALRERHGILFVVRDVAVRYLAPARLEDQLVVTTRVGAIEGVCIGMGQDVLRDGLVLAKCRVGLACVGPGGRPVRVPAAVAAALGALPPLADDV
jgi:acyl-CoA thioester hydrolase